VSGLYSCGCKPLSKLPKYCVIGGAGNASCWGGSAGAGCIGGGGGNPGINPCVVACANVKTGVDVVVSRHNEKRPGCSLYNLYRLLIVSFVGIVF